MRVFTVIRASLLVGPTRHGDHYYCECAQYNVITGRCYAAGYAPRDKRRIGRSCAHTHLERLFRTAKNYCGDLCGTYGMVPSTWVVITASAVRRTVTHVNAHRAARKRRSSRRRSCYLGSHSRRSVCREMKEETEVKEEIPRRTRGVYPGD